MPEALKISSNAVYTLYQDLSYSREEQGVKSREKATRQEQYTSESCNASTTRKTCRLDRSLDYRLLCIVSLMDCLALYRVKISVSSTAVMWQQVHWYG